MVGAFAAKEVFVAQMGILFAVVDENGGSEALRARLSQAYSPLQAFCLLLFCLMSAPCAATIACTWKESGSPKWANLQLLGLTALAYVLTMAVLAGGCNAMLNAFVEGGRVEPGSFTDYEVLVRYKRSEDMPIVAGGCRNEISGFSLRQFDVSR